MSKQIVLTLTVPETQMILKGLTVQEPDSIPLKIRILDSLLSVLTSDETPDPHTYVPAADPASIPDESRAILSKIKAWKGERKGPTKGDLVKLGYAPAIVSAALSKLLADKKITSQGKARGTFYVAR